MPSSGQIHLLNKFANLANRCGLSPTVANVEINFRKTVKDNKEDYVWSVGVFDIEGGPADEKEEENFQKFWSLLGLESQVQAFDSLRDIEKVVDRALSLAPRARAR